MFYKDPVVKVVRQNKNLIFENFLNLLSWILFSYKHCYRRTFPFYLLCISITLKIHHTHTCFVDYISLCIKSYNWIVMYGSILTGEATTSKSFFDTNLIRKTVNHAINNLCVEPVSYICYFLFFVAS